MSDKGDLYVDGPAKGVKARILLTHFEGSMDAGGAGALSVSQILGATPSERVATFDTDALVDYRSHRPIVTVRDWVTQEMDIPEIALDLVHDDVGESLLVLHGPEPDAKWDQFAQTIIELAKESGVEIAFSLTGIPSGVPHTRPTPVHVHATDSDLLPEQPKMAGTMQFPASVEIYLTTRLSEEGIAGMNLLASVPYYMTENAYPAAASALLVRLGQLAHLALPVGDLERGASEDMEQVQALIDQNPEVGHTIEALEHHFDAIDGANPAALTQTRDASLNTTSDDIVGAIEAYLASREQIRTLKQQGSSSLEGTATPSTAHVDTLEDVFRRLRNKERGQGNGTHRPRHSS